MIKLKINDKVKIKYTDKFTHPCRIIFSSKIGKIIKINKGIYFIKFKDKNLIGYDYGIGTFYKKDLLKRKF